MGAELVLSLILLQQAAPVAPDVREAARRAEAAYERAARRYAPFVGWRGAGGECDEIVGRFCLRFDAEPADAPPEPARITDARRAAIDSLRRYFTVLPGDFTVSGALVRLLIEDGRASEAASAALTFGAATDDSVMGPLLEGLALQMEGSVTAAAERFLVALARMPSEDAERARSIEWLLTPAERGRYRDLDAEQRRRYEQALWGLSDPMYLIPGNEAWTEHVARYAYARLLEDAPVVTDMNRWGRDLEELTMRYGVAYRRGRQHGTRLGESGIVEYFDPAQLAYVPPDMETSGMAPQPEPGHASPLTASRARSAHAPVAVRSMDELPHQVTRIPTAHGWLVRIDATFGLDSLARVPPDPLPGDTARPPAPRPGLVRVGLWLVEPHAATVLDSTHGVVRLDGDTADVRLVVPAGADDLIYAIEAFESESRTARRARYALSFDTVAGNVRVSDVLLTAPLDGETPASHETLRADVLTRLVLAPGERVGVFVQAADPGPGAYTIEVSLRRADAASLPRRLVRWLGRSLGLTSAPVPPRVRWEQQHAGGAPLVVAVDLTLDDVERGLQLIEVAIEDARTGARGRALRLVRIE